MLRSVLAPGGKKNWLQLQIKVCKHTFKNYLRFEITLTFFLFQDLFYSIYTNLDETEKNLPESGSFYPASAKITGSATLRPVNIKLLQLCLICIGEAKARIGWYWVSQSWRISPVDVGRFPGRYITIIEICTYVSLNFFFVKVPAGWAPACATCSSSPTPSSSRCSRSDVLLKLMQEINSQNEFPVFFPWWKPAIPLLTSINLVGRGVPAAL